MGVSTAVSGEAAAVGAVGGTGEAGGDLGIAAVAHDACVQGMVGPLWARRGESPVPALQVVRPVAVFLGQGQEGPGRC